MPADGEFTFSSLLKNKLRSDAQRLRGNSCMRPAFVNCLFSGAFSFAGTYVYYGSARKSSMICGLVGSTALLVTSVVCTVERLQKK